MSRQLSPQAACVRTRGMHSATSSNLARRVRVPGSLIILIALRMMLGSATSAHAGAPAHGSVYLSNLDGPVYLLAYAYDGSGHLDVSPVHIVATVPRGGGMRRKNRDLVYVVGAGIVSAVNLADETVSSVSANNNANTATLSPDGNTLWVGWKDTVPASVPLQPFGVGIPHPVTGDDSVATMIAFTPAHGTFYTTGGEFAAESGNMGHIDLGTFITSRSLSDVHATGINYDPFSGSLIIAGVGRATQIDPGNPTSVISSRDDSIAGENYLVLEPDGLGHLIGTRFGSEPRLVFIDYSESGMIGSGSSIIISAPLPNSANLSGGPTLEPDVIFRSRFE